MRTVMIVSIQVAIDVDDNPSGWEATVTDVLTGILTEEMQMFNAGKGELVNWMLNPYPLESNVKLVRINDKATYEEGEAFNVSEYLW